MTLPLEKIKFHAEYHSNINSITLSVQVPPSGLTCRIGPEAIDLIPSNHALQQGLDDATMSTAVQGKTVKYTPPVMVMPTRTTLDSSSSQSSQLTLKLAALPRAYSSSPSSTSALKTPSGSEFPPAPLPAAQLQGLENLACGCCGNTLLKCDSDNDNECDNSTRRGPIQRVVDLPSEHWQELVDCWMCHEEDFTELREGDLGARTGQALVGGTYTLIHAADVDHDAVVIEEDARVIDWTKGIKRRWRPLACSRCLYPIGDGWYQSQREDGTDLEMIQVKFLKYMVGFRGENKQRRQPLNIPRQRFPSYVAAEIFESARHHATYRFILQDRFQGRDMMLLWMLNWDTMINTNQEPVQDSFIQWDQSLESDLKPANNSAGAGRSNTQGNKKVMKVLYLQAPPPEGRGQQQTEETYSKEMQLWDRWRSDPGVERLEFQERLILGLMTLLEQSTSCLPPNLNGPASTVLAMEDMSHEQEASWTSMIPTFSQLIQLYFILITTIAFLAATLPSLRDSILIYGKLDSPTSPSTPSTTSSFTSASVPEENVRKSDFFTVLKSFRVPKTWFAHFYMFATLWMIYLSLDLAIYSSSSSARQLLPTAMFSTHRYWSFLSLLNTLSIMPSQPTTSSSNNLSSVLPFPSTGSSVLSWTPPPEVLLAMACYLTHVIRRWYETWFVERPSAQAKIHVGQYLVGISFYAAIAPALWVDAYESWNRELQAQAQDQEQVQGEQGSVLEHSYGIRPSAVICLIGLVLFLWGSWHQHQCHVILANLRSPVSASSTFKGIKERVEESRQEQKHMPRKQEYKVPFGDWFKYMVTPHYSAEMVIYFGFLLMVSSSGAVKGMAMTLLIAWVWVVVNLGIVARETDQWYRMRFGEEYADTNAMDNVQQQSRSKQERTRTRIRRAILIPFVY